MFIFGIFFAFYSWIVPFLLFALFFGVVSFRSFLVFFSYQHTHINESIICMCIRTLKHAHKYIHRMDCLWLIIIIIIGMIIDRSTDCYSNTHTFVWTAVDINFKSAWFESVFLFIISFYLLMLPMLPICTVLCYFFISKEAKKPLMIVGIFFITEYRISRISAK